MDSTGHCGPLERLLVSVLCIVLSFPVGYLSPRCMAATLPQDNVIANVAGDVPDTQAAPVAPNDSTVYLDAELALPVAESDSIPPTEVRADDYAYDENGKIPFNPSPTRAVWLSALCPGLGQIYNRRYWKLPIVIGGFMGLGYA